jgi:hypothetical protein
MPFMLAVSIESFMKMLQKSGFDAEVDARHKGFIKLRGPKEVEVEDEACLDVRV